MPLRRYVWLGLEAIAWIAFASYRIAEAAASAPAVWQDSEAYRVVATSGWFSTRLWTGPRPPLTPLLMKLSGLQYGR